MKHLRILKRVLFPLPILLLLTPPQVWPQATLKTLPGDTLQEAKRVFTAPFHMSLGEAALAGGIMATDLGVYSLDTKIRTQALNKQSPTANNTFNIFEKFGNAGYDAAFLIAYGGAGKIFGNDYMAETAVLAGESLMVANATGLFLKYTVGRYRPYTGNGHKDFSPFNMTGDGSSFPSGHTISAFSVASVFAARAESPWVSALVYLLASGVAVQRVYADKHWASDVIAGAAIGTLIGRDIVRTNAAKTTSNLKLMPSANGVALRLKF